MLSAVKKYVELYIVPHPFCVAVYDTLRFAPAAISGIIHLMLPPVVSPASDALWSCVPVGRLSVIITFFRSTALLFVIVREYVSAEPAATETGADFIN